MNPDYVFLSSILVISLFLVVYIIKLELSGILFLKFRALPNEVKELRREVMELNQKISRTALLSQEAVWKLQFERDKAWAIHYSNVRLVTSTFFMGLSLAVLGFALKEGNLLAFWASVGFWAINCLLFFWFTRWTLWAHGHQETILKYLEYGKNLIKADRTEDPEAIARDWDLCSTQKTHKQKRRAYLKKAFWKDDGVKALLLLTAFYVLCIWQLSNNVIWKP